MDDVQQFYLLTKARSAIADGKYELARELASKASETDQQSVAMEASMLIGVCWAYLDHDDAAISAFADSIEIGMSTRHFEFLPYRFFCDVEDLISTACHQTGLRSSYGFPYDSGDDVFGKDKSLAAESARRGEKRRSTWDEKARIERAAIRSFVERAVMRSVEAFPDVTMALEAIEDGDLGQGVDFLYLLSDENDPEAFYQLGRLYADEKYEKADDIEAVRLLSQAAEYGMLEAQMLLAAILGDENRICYDPEKSAEWMLQVALTGDSNAQLQLGMKLIQGVGLSTDYAEAAAWLKASSTQGNQRAKLLLGMLFFEGKGVEQDFQKSGQLWLECAKSGLPEAAYHLGVLCMRGHQFLPNFAPTPIFENELDHWLQKSALNGYPMAQLLLGVERARGEYLKQDYRIAFRWLSNARANGLADAQVFLDHLLEELGEDEFRRLEANQSPIILSAVDKEGRGEFDF
jgi:TPR repeat protein